MMRPVAILASLAALSQAAAAAGVPEAPSLKPARPYVSSVTDSHNAEILHKALRAAERYDWPSVAHLQTQASDADVRNLIMWIRASRGVPGMNFSEVSYALDKLEGFASHYGPDFYGLERNEGTITLVREDWAIPDEITLPNDKPIVPFFAGHTVHWKLQQS